METFETYDLRQRDPSGGVLAMMAHWRPRVKDPNPDHPGEKATTLSYLPTKAEASCPLYATGSFVVPETRRNSPRSLCGFISPWPPKTVASISDACQ
ncbi:hypothetical protein [Ktedonobacter racemifer]|uniref:Uncharacterized protein n=1 Tax=Ktedonobacter racemifer DSM 44963 TaxID=485913 RepID=D6TQ89_KTERA|nr:hypothetical protein [Ktedonobacter racemifer]EFH85737.1 hypothetical protein Krac_6971 [Ktedonobacter racemifer DSM 44963]